MSKPKTFEESVKALEDIVEALENGDLPLEEAVKKYQEGMQLSKHCHTLLEEAEKVLTKVIKANGEEAPFDVEE